MSAPHFLKLSRTVINLNCVRLIKFKSNPNPNYTIIMDQEEIDGMLFAGTGGISSVQDTINVCSKTEP